MNEKIKQLALQAGEYVNSVYTPPVRSKTPGKIWEDGHIDWMEQFHEKFAELIIQECAQDFDKTYMSGGETVGNYIRRKFGVEK
jgi:hypothetical protein